MTKRAWFYLIITFIISWVIAIVFKFLGGKWYSDLGIIIAVLYMFSPLFSVVILEKFIYHNKVKETCAINFNFNIWFLLAWLLPIVISFSTLAVAGMFPGVEITASMEGFFEHLSHSLTPQQLQQIKKHFDQLSFNPIMFMIIQSLIAGITINAAAAFGEEIGWRGFLYNELTKRFNFWQTSLITGLIWGLWHAPLVLQGYNYPNYPYIGVLWMIIFCILYSPVFNFIREKSGSVVATSILHGTLNATYGFSIIFLKGGNELTVGMLGLAGFIVLLIIDIIIFLSTKL